MTRYKDLKPTTRKFITAMVLVAITVPLLIIGSWATVALATIICIGGIKEIFDTCRDKHWHWAVKLTIMLGSLVMLYWSLIMAWIDGPEVLYGAEPFMIPDDFRIRINLIVIIAYLIILLVLECVTKAFMMVDVFYIFTMTLFITISCQTLMFLRLHHEEAGLASVGFIFLVTCACDAAAQVCGHKFGKHKFAPITSPKKTWEGVIGGVTVATILGTVYTFIFPYMTADLNKFIYGPIMSLILAIGAVMGDLIFSSIKRQVHIKDFGDILPEHGGILDRFDSLLFNLLIFLCFIIIFERGLLR